MDCSGTIKNGEMHHSLNDVTLINYACKACGYGHLPKAEIKNGVTTGTIEIREEKAPCTLNR